MSLFIDILSDGLFAAVAAMGFGSISDPPLRAFPYIAILAALGHAARFCLMTLCGVDIVSASLVAAFIIGSGSVYFGKKVACPMTVLYIPALLPMVPGTYAYKTVFSLIMFFQENGIAGIKVMVKDMTAEPCSADRPESPLSLACCERCETPDVRIVMQAPAFAMVEFLRRFFSLFCVFAD